MLPIVRVGWTRPSRSYFRSVCGCMPSSRRRHADEEELFLQSHGHNMQHIEYRP